VPAVDLTGSAGELRVLSDRLTEAARTLRATPDPTHERLVSTRAQLATLVTAEAERVAQEATISSAAQRRPLQQEAERLALIADELFDPRLHRDSGFPRSALGQTLAGEELKT
jgi:IS4 transposase